MERRFELRSPKEFLKRSLALSCGVWATNIAMHTLGPTINSSPEESISTVVAAARPFQNPKMDVLVIDTEGQSKQSNDRLIRDSLQNTSEKIEFATDDAASLGGDAPIHHISATPDGRGESNGKACFTGEQTRQFHDEWRANRNLGKTSIVSLVFSGAADCSSHVKIGPGRWPAAAYKTESEGQPYLVFNSVSNLGAMAHELGHTVLPHARQLNIVNERGSSYSWIDTADFDDQNYVRPYGMVLKAGEPKTAIDEKNLKWEYSAKDSIMGSADIDKRPMLFTAGELAEIAPNRFSILDVPNVPADYELSMQEGGSIGIRLALPADHELKKIDKGISSIIVGLQVRYPDEIAKPIKSIDDPNAEWRIIVTAKGADATYVLGHSEMYDYNIDSLKPDARLDAILDQNSKRLTDTPPDESFVYLDSESDIAVTSYRSRDGKAMVRVGDSKTTAHIRQLRKQELDRRIKDIG